MDDPLAGRKSFKQLEDFLHAAAFRAMKFREN